MASLRLTNSTAPGTPTSGKTEVYVDTDKKLKTKDDAGLVRPLASLAAMGSTPPSAPQDGDLWIYNGTAGIWWLFGYDSTETTYKWKYIGGPPLVAEVATGQSTLSGTYVDLGTVVSITIPRSGDYILAHGAQSINASGGTHQQSNVGLKLGAAAMTANEVFRTDQNGSGGVDATSGSKSGMRRTLVAGDVIKQQYATDGAATYQYFQRWITAIPARVS